MTKFPQSSTGPTVGRPPLNKDSVTKATMVRLTKETRDRIEALVGKRKMAAYMRAAVEKQLDADERAAKRKPDA